MTRKERLNIYKRLCMHPKFDTLPERLQEALLYMAVGYTDRELMKLYKISHGTAWSYRESIFKRYGLRMWIKDKINGHTKSFVRAMTMEEIKQSNRLFLYFYE